MEMSRDESKAAWKRERGQVKGEEEGEEKRHV